MTTEADGGPVVFQGSSPVRVCAKCYEAHERGKPWEYEILDLDNFGPGEPHIVMDDGTDRPLCERVLADARIRYDGWCKDDGCPHTGTHTHGDAGWRAYWDGLTPAQQQWIKDKANWERMTLSAIAIEYGAPPVVAEPTEEAGNG